MFYPAFLKENCTIGVPAPSDAAKDAKKVNKYQKIYIIQLWLEVVMPKLEEKS